MKVNLKERTTVVSSKSVYEVFINILSLEDDLDKEKEHFWVIGLDTQNVIQYIDLVYLGTLNSCPLRISEIYRLACIKNVASLIAIHNHPSGNTQPSNEDKKATEKIRQAGDILGIKFLDHVIVGGEQYYSFSDEGLIL